MSSPLESSQRALMIGVAALVLTLLFVGFQVREANQLAGQAVETRIAAESLRIEQMAVESSNHAKLLVKLAAQSGTLSKSEYEQSRAYALVMVRHWMAIEDAHQDGFLDDDVFESYELGMAYALKRYPGLRQVVTERLSESGLGPDHASGFVARIHEEIGKYL